MSPPFASTTNKELLKHFLLATEMEGFITLMFFLLSSNIVSSDQSYEACNPTDCGGLKLTYPFYVAGRQSLYCGLPGLQVSCKQSLALLNLSGDTYIIRNISYTDQTLWIVNSAFSHSTFECSNITSVHNLTLNNTRLEFTSKPVREIVLLQDCSIKALKAMSNSTKVICNNNPYRNRSNSVVGAYDEDLNWKEVAGECRLAASVPYEDSSASKLEDKMRAGVSLKWISNDTCQLCQKNGGLCVYHQTTATLDFQYCLGSNDYGSNNVCVTSEAVHTVMWVGGVVIILVLGLVLIIVICCTRICIRIIKSAIKRAKSRSQTGRDNRNLEHFIRNQESLAPKRYTYKEIKKMTKSLKEKLGEGGFSMVYKGKLLDGRLVAVKLLKQSKGDVQDFINEVASMSGTNHVNVVALLGFCIEGRKRCLVYEFMPNGSLEKYRRAGANNQSLSWETLFEIALGIARGLEYLHRGCNTRILHFDIKPHNILLGENFCPKISDFGLAKLCPQSERSRVSMSEARGTIGYIAPEVFCRNFGDVSHKSDVCSYGMMVLEVIGCRDNANANADTCSSQYFPHWIYRKLNRDQEQDAEEIMNDEEKSLQRKMILVSLWCIQTMPFSRPSMDRVVQMLEGSLDSIEVPPIPTLTSPPRPPPSDPSGSSTITIDSYSERTSEP